MTKNGLPFPDFHVQEWWDVNWGVPVPYDLVDKRGPLVSPVIDVLLLDLLGSVANAVLINQVRLQLQLLFGADDWFDARTWSRVDHVGPVTRASGRQLHVAFDEEDAGIADLSAAFLDEAEAFLKQGFVPFAVGETGAEIEKMY